MVNKTYIPAFKAKVGNWDYYICQMKYAEVARAVYFAFELGANRDLATMIQRSLQDRASEIRRYLLRSEHRFLGALIVATWGGDPDYIPLRMDDPDGMLADLDRDFGVLVLDGTHSFFTLDGQHRLKAIKDAIKYNPTLGKEDICVLLVPHHDTEEGRERTQRLFTNINRNAKATTKAENIALDVDDAFALLTRRLLDNHIFLREDGRVRVFSKPPTEEGHFSLAPKQIPPSHPRALTSITALYELTQNLCFDSPKEIQDKTTRPTDELLRATYATLAQRIDGLLEACGNVRATLEAANSARDVRAPTGSAETGHAFMRPVVQLSVTRTLRYVMSQDLLSWDDALKALNNLDWTIGQAPWTAIFNPVNGKIVSGKDHTNLLDRLLMVHIAPTTRAEIKRARKEFKEVIGANYPVSEQDLARNLPRTSQASIAKAEMPAEPVAG